MFKIIKILIVLAIVVVLLIAGVVSFALYRLNDLTKSAIEQGGTYAMGVPTKVDSVSVGLLSGKFGLTGLNIANPTGFTGPHFLTLGRGDLALDLASIQQPVVTVPTFALTDIDVRLERKPAGSNYQAILDSIKKTSEQISTATGGSSGSAPSSGGDKKLVINDLSLRNIKIHVDLLAAPGAVGEALNAATRVTIPIDEIKLQNVGKTGTGVSGTGVTVSQLASIIVQAVLGAASEKGVGVLPADFLSDLNGQLAGLGGLKNIQTQIIGNAQATVEQLGQQVTQQIGQQVGKEAGKAVEGLTKGLEGLIPGKKAAPPAPAPGEKKPGG
jgi:uncharacterized protein involved in outer membrane biogenesis